MFLSVALILISLQVWSAISARNVVIDARRAAVMDHKDDIDLEKARQELIGRRIDNDSKGVIQTVLAERCQHARRRPGHHHRRRDVGLAQLISMPRTGIAGIEPTRGTRIAASTALAAN